MGTSHNSFHPGVSCGPGTQPLGHRQAIMLNLQGVCSLGRRAESPENSELFV